MTNTFEKVYQTDLSRESHHQIEKHSSIELSHAEYLERIERQKIALSKKLLKKCEIITLNSSEPPLISMDLDMPTREKSINEGKKKTKSKSKSKTKKAKRSV